MPLKEPLDYGKMGRQAMYIAIRNKRLKALKVGGRWAVSRAAIDEYKLNRHNGDLRQKEGKFVFSQEEGRCSVGQTAKICSEALGRRCNTQTIYYLIRVGVLKAHKYGCAWVILKADLIKYIEKRAAARENKDQLRFA